MKIIKRIRDVITNVNFIKAVDARINHLILAINEQLSRSSNSVQQNLIGKLLIESNNKKDSLERLSDVEFKVFSQWGDDGIIQFLINKLDIKHKTFVEFGVENYTESNTRFLLVNNNWSGLVIDGSESHINYIKNDIISWAHDLYARHAFITAENINELLNELPFGQELGILSIDIDGCDYWVWKAINVVRADIVIIEYNSCFGDASLWTIPYKHDFIRSREPDKISYFGVSISALKELGDQKGYDFVGCNSAGNNAYFIRKEINTFFKPLSAREGFVESKFAEGLLSNGDRIRGKSRLNMLKGMPVFNLKSGAIESI